jgi:hypothetical protein
MANRLLPADQDSRSRQPIKFGAADFRGAHPWKFAGDRFPQRERQYWVKNGADTPTADHRRRR